MAARLLLVHSPPLTHSALVAESLHELLGQLQ